MRAGTVREATEAAEAAGVPTDITPGSRITLHSLSMRAGKDEWIVGNPETGEFIAVPPVAVRAVELLRDGHAVGEVQSLLKAETGSLLAISDFVESLRESGFVDAVDGVAQRKLEATRPSIPWLKREHVRFFLHPAFHVGIGALLFGAVIALGIRHQVPLTYHAIVWTRYSGLAILVAAVIGWLIIFLHELGHLVTARAAGAPARITLGTRLRFLVAQTDVSGIWTAPRRIRVAVYLSGMCIDFSIAVILLVILSYAHPSGVAGKIVALGAVEAFLMLPPQFMVFMRTDVYFLIQDLADCPNLYADGLAFLRRALKKTPQAERRLVKVYALAVIIGSAICILTEFTVSIPALVVIVINAFREFSQGFIGAADGATAILVVVCFQVLWARSWRQRHGRRFLNWLSGSAGRSQSQPGPFGKTRI